MNEALVHTVAMLVSAVAALFLGQVTDSGIPDFCIDVALAAMLYFVFVCIDAGALRRSFSDVRFTTASVLINFLWTPFFALGLGYLFFGGEPDVRIGLLLALAAPCTDWYLVFTASAKGDVPLSSSILPLNMLLQLILVPAYLVLFFGSDLRITSYMPVLAALLTVVIPFLMAYAVRWSSVRSPAFGKVRECSERKASLGQIVFLCIAVFIMFYTCSGDIVGNSGVILECLAPLVMFFIVNLLVSCMVYSKAGWGRGKGVSLVFTTLARNSPLMLAVMSPIFSGHPLVLAVLVVCPLVELPYLSLVSYLFARPRKQ